MSPYWTASQPHSAINLTSSINLTFSIYSTCSPVQDALEQAEAAASAVQGKEDDARSKASTALGHYHAGTPDSRAGPEVEALEKQVRP